MNIQTRKPVRVVRGFKLKRSSKWAPKVGCVKVFRPYDGWENDDICSRYRYDGLYRVVKVSIIIR
jgi:hypothetical protein